MIKYSWEFGMPSADTFDCIPIGNFVRRYLATAVVSIDPFARNREWFTWTNDLNPNTKAQHHIEAADFLVDLYKTIGQTVDLGIIDPPYSPTQVKTEYENIGIVAARRATTAGFYSDVKDAMLPLIKPGGIVLSFGWNSGGMGKKRGFEKVELLITFHGSSRHDTLCVAERKTLLPMFDK